MQVIPLTHRAARPTLEQIAAAQARLLETDEIYRLRSGGPFHEHTDCILIAFEWLDAQRIVKQGEDRGSLKVRVECWAKRYISESDVRVAAHLHPRIKGRYPAYNLSNRRVRPALSRIEGLDSVGRHLYGEVTPEYPIHEDASLNRVSPAGL
jgi:hypothetical protein